MTLSFQKATPASSYLRMALCGGPGAGKTWTSLALATGLGEKIALLDTEHGSARKYAGDFDFDVCELESFHPQHYIDAMVAAHQAGYDVLIIDSLSHAWAGKDGALELVDQARASGKDNPFTAWRHVTPLQHQLTDTMLGLPMHLIVTMRTKVAYVIEEDARGKPVPRKVGMAPIQREGCEYEFDVIGDLHRTVLSITKTRLRFLQGLVLESDPQDPITAGRELGARIAADLLGQGERPGPSAAPAAGSHPIKPQQINQLWSRITQHGVDPEVFRAYLQGLHLQSTKELTAGQLEQCLRELKTRKGQAFQPQDTPDPEAKPPTPGARTPLFEALAILLAEMTQAEQAQAPGEPHPQGLIDLAQWVPRVVRACENPDTPESQLQHYLTEVNEALAELREILMKEAAA